MVRSQLVSLEFFIDIKSFRSHYGPGVVSASKRNELPGAFPGGKGGRCVRLTTLPPSCAVVVKSWNLNFLEPSGPLQACNGTALPFALHQHRGIGMRQEVGVKSSTLMRVVYLCDGVSTLPRHDPLVLFLSLLSAAGSSLGNCQSFTMQQCRVTAVPLTANC